MRANSSITCGLLSSLLVVSSACVDGSSQGGPPLDQLGGGASAGTTGSTGGAAGAGASSPSAGASSAGASSSGGASGSAGAAGSTGLGGTGGTGSTGTGTMPTAADALAAYEKFKGYFETCPDSTVRVKTNGEETVSEGIAYGMLAAVAHGDRTNFDGLWAYYKNHTNDRGVMDWKIAGCSNTVWEAGAASDADLDAAMALVQAECKWGGYDSDATALITAIHDSEITDGGSEKVLKPGDVWGGGNCTNPSYFSPGYYRVFATRVPAQAGTWNKLADDSYVILARADNDATGLVPDWCDVGGKAGGGDGCRNDKVNYTYDAARTPWRIATDYVWYQTPAAKTYLTTMTNWVGDKIYNVGDGYSLTGTMLSEYHNSVFTGGFALAALAHSEEKTSEFMGGFLAVNPTADNAYFQTALRAVYLLLPTGLFPKGC